MGTFFYLLAFGSNLGDRQSHFKSGLEKLSHWGRVLKQSRWRVTAPLKSAHYATDEHEDFLNFVCVFESTFEPHTLFSKLQEIEDSIGHSRHSKWLPRNLDIDILFCAKGAGDFESAHPVQVEDATLQIPHTGFWQRDFLVELVIQDLKINRDTLESHRSVAKNERN